MIAINKSKIKIPASLTDNTRTTAFAENVKQKKYVSENKYKTDEVFKSLKELYNYKCAYCEDILLNTPKAIEHYRPKNSDNRKNVF